MCDKRSNKLISSSLMRYMASIITMTFDFQILGRDWKILFTSSTFEVSLSRALRPFTMSVKRVTLDIGPLSFFLIDSYLCTCKLILDSNLMCHLKCIWNLFETLATDILLNSSTFKPQRDYSWLLHLRRTIFILVIPFIYRFFNN